MKEPLAKSYKLKAFSFLFSINNSLLFYSAKESIFSAHQKINTMKKITALLLTFFSIAMVQAQSSKDEARKIILGQPRGNNGSSSSGKDIILGKRNPGSYPDSRENSPYGSREYQINQVNREYDAKIYSIRNNGTLSPSEKERMIRQLEEDRSRKIRDINKRCGKEKKRKDDDDRHDHGKHKGWKKKADS